MTQTTSVFTYDVCTKLARKIIFEYCKNKSSKRMRVTHPSSLCSSTLILVNKTCGKDDLKNYEFGESFWAVIFG
jgi:hypothetical protein